jgi:hypothetical protein
MIETEREKLILAAFKAAVIKHGPPFDMDAIIREVRATVPEFYIDEIKTALLMRAAGEEMNEAIEAGEVVRLKDGRVVAEEYFDPEIHEPDES